VGKGSTPAHAADRAGRICGCGGATPSRSRRGRARRSGRPSFLSVVVPALNEAAGIAAALDSVPPGSEAVVADGGSRDGTPTAVRRWAAGAGRRRRVRARVLVLRGAPRGALLNAGARAARGGVLLFLHADTALPPGAGRAVARALRDPAVAGGAFSLSFDDPRPSLRLVALSAGLRSRFLGLPYGDQALFCRRDVFDALGGFRPWPLLEDADFARRLRAAGRVVLLPEHVRSSARRYVRLGVARTIWRNAAILTRWAVGVPPAVLARDYRRD
jgi:rSAM/selenodomain-associated transferase 2